LRVNQSVLERHVAGQSEKLHLAKDEMRAEIADRKRSEAGLGRTSLARRIPRVRHAQEAK
jgi:hypothetical protein